MVSEETKKMIENEVINRLMTIFNKPKSADSLARLTIKFTIDEVEEYLSTKNSHKL